MCASQLDALQLSTGMKMVKEIFLVRLRDGACLTDKTGQHPSTELSVGQIFACERRINPFRTMNYSFGDNTTLAHVHTQIQTKAYTDNLIHDPLSLA